MEKEKKCLGCGADNAKIVHQYRHLQAHFCNTECQAALHLEMWMPGMMPLERGGRSRSSSGSRSSSSDKSSRSRSSSRGRRRYRSRLPGFIRHRGEYYTRTGWKARGGPRFWRKPRYGFGYSLWVTWRYPQLLGFLPYSLWYPAGDWVPYYYVADEEYINAYTKDGKPIPPSAYVKNSEEFGAVELPRLPTFASLGVSVGDLVQTDSIEAAKARDSISAELSNLRTQYATEESRGFRVVPDLDRAQFSWVKIVA